VQPAAGWHGSLELQFAARASETRLVLNRHSGPLRLLKALRSEDGRRLEAVIVHPPGGLVGGDSLAIDLLVQAGARTLATTPGAQKWYRGESLATASTRLVIAAGGLLEWLPQPSILFDRARARQALAIELEPTAACVGWEILVRGRGAMGERFRSGHVDQTLSIAVGGGLLWQERLHADAADRLFDSALGWDRRRIAASVWCCAPSEEREKLQALRDQWRVLLDPAGAAVVGGATLAADGLVLAKLLADDSEQLTAVCRRLWRAARISLEGDAGSAPRIWRT
jgi:urease accessory protein